MNQKQKNKTSFGSDHYIHVSIIEKIKLNGFKYGVDKISGYNEENSTYPILFHYILARFFYNLAITKPNIIGNVINILSVIVFNFFLFNFSGFIEFIFLLKANLVFLIFPFSYIYWNAKNMGLSARGFGLLIGQIFTYSLVLYIQDDSSLWLSIMSLFSFASLLGSQFAFQYVILISISSSVLFGKLELLFPLIFSITSFRLLLPKFSKEFFRGQFNHKRNYALFLAPIYIFKIRPSIYRDFIYDFWIRLVKLKTQKVEALYYIYSNPILELIYGFPFLWVSLYYDFNNGYNEQLTIIDSIIKLSLVIFFIISLRPFRFLGEPQRYVEFVIPLISILFLNAVPEKIQLIFILGSIIYIAITKLIFHLFREYSNHNHDEITHYLKINYSSETVIASNDSNFSKFLIPYFNIVKTDLTKYFNSINEFNFYHYNDFAIHSVNGLLEFHTKYKVNLFIIKPLLYSQNEMTKLYSKIDLEEIITINNYIIYKTQDVKKAL